MQIAVPGKERINYQYNGDEQRSISYYGNDESDIADRSHQKFYSAIAPIEITWDVDNDEVKIHTYIGGDQYSSSIVYEKTSTEEQMLFLHRDYLGSILAITDEEGDVIERRHFGAWGSLEKLVKNGNEVDLYDSSTDKTLLLDRGYTGHEHLYGVSLIHMNGRLYDPMLRRFLAPDNHIQDPYNTQNFNRYGYVYNNPLIYSDLSGEFIVAALIGAAIAVVTNGINNSINGQGFFEGAGKAAIFGAISGALSFGIGQVATTISNSVGTGAAAAFQAGAHSVVGGTMAELQGGSFQSGAFAGGISSIVGGLAGSVSKNWGSVGRAIAGTGAGAVSGGIGSEIAGGNFWDGFRQGAITAGLNHGVHDGWFGANVAAAAMAQQLRHLFGPDAISYVASLNASSLINVGAEKGKLLVLRGNDKGIHPLNEISAGLGGLDVSITGEMTNLYYSGSENDISANTFYGARWEANAAIDFGLSAGINAIYSKVGQNFVVGFGPTIGFGYSATILSGNINWGASGANLKTIRNAINTGLNR